MGSSIMDSGWVMYGVGMVFRYGLMELNMKVNGRTERPTAKVDLF